MDVPRVGLALNSTEVLVGIPDLWGTVVASMGATEGTGSMVLVVGTQDLCCTMITLVGTIEGTAAVVQWWALWLSVAPWSWWCVLWTSTIPSSQ